MFWYDFGIGTGVPKPKRGMPNTEITLNISYGNFNCPVVLFLNDEMRNIPEIEEEHT